MQNLKILRHRGFLETLKIIHDSPGSEISQSDFFKTLNQQGCYPNVFFRVKQPLLDMGIIRYKLNDKNDKMIELTEKGHDIWKKLENLNTLCEMSEMHQAVEV